ncbi:hypothetical protein GCM10010341_50260 [Streptomyces noursei]|nr:hypothetical protein GCM10010341_50260 [Streptomyces noursei]
MDVTGLLSGIKRLFPLFGIAYRRPALAIGTALLIKSGRLKWVWGTGAPLLGDLAFPQAGRCCVRPIPRCAVSPNPPTLVSCWRQKAMAHR